MSRPPTEAELVLQLLGDREFYGLDLVERSGGVLKRGLVYLLLYRMEQEGLITSREEPMTEQQAKVRLIPRRLYKRVPKARPTFPSGR